MKQTGTAPLFECKTAISVETSLDIQCSPKMAGAGVESRSLFGHCRFRGLACRCDTGAKGAGLEES